jgi:hypothetical protein
MEGTPLFYIFAPMRKSLLIVIFILLNNLPVNAQDWIRIYGNNMIADVSWVIETYDKGYLILDNSHDYLWLIKTDINGYKLWEKWIGTGQNHIRFGNIEETLDYGYILAGGFSKYGGQYDDPAIIKLNSCGELDWCEVIKTPGVTNDFATRVKPTPQGDYVLLTLYSNPDADSCIQLFKFNGTGDLIWKHSYFPDSLIWAPEVHDVRVDDDGYLISAMCYYPDPQNPTIGYERPYYIKTDTAGNILWWLVYGSGNGFHGFIWDATIKSSTGNFYSIGVHSNYCDNTALVKCMGNGQESYYHDFIPGLCPGGYFSSVNFVDDSTIISTACGTLNGNAIHRWLKMDTLGIMNTFKEFPSWICGTTHTVRTLDNKFVSVAMEGGIWIYLYKLNSNLDYDSIYTHPYTYDSLCPGGVISDTINPDCDLIVKIDEPTVESESSQMKVYPNPAIGSLTVEFPKYLKTTDKKSGITSSTVFYQWKSTTLEIYDLSGKHVFSKEIPKEQQRLEMNVSGWDSGMYYFRLVYNNQTVSSEKVIIQ